MGKRPPPVAGFKKGVSGNPKGRTPILLPEVQKAIDANRNAVKVIILDSLTSGNTLKDWVNSIIEQGIGDGDVLRFKYLVEMALGKMINEPPEFPLTEEEKILVLEYRRRKLERDNA